VTGKPDGWTVGHLRSKIRAVARKNKVVHALGSKALRFLRRHRARHPRTPTRPASGPLSGYESLLTAGKIRTVVMLADARQHGRVLRWLRQFPTDHVHTISAEDPPDWQSSPVQFTHHKGESLNELSELIKLIGPVDVLVDLMPGDAEEHEAIWRRLFFNLNPGGVYVVDRHAVQSTGFRSAMSSWVARITTADEPEPLERSGDRNYADATASVSLSRDLFIIKKRRKHYLKLRDAETSRVLPAREPAVRVTELATLPSGELVSTARVTSHEAAVPIPWLPERMTYPPMHLRHYEGRIAFIGNTLLHTEHSILPDSFRWHLESNPRNPRIKRVSPSFALIPSNLRPEETVTGNFYQLDPQGTGHFGHIMTEVVARLWGWDEAKKQIPDLKAIFRVRNSDVRDPVEPRLFQAYGIAEEDIVWVDHPVYLTSLVSATAMWHNAVPHYVHPALIEVWDRLGRNLVDPNAPVYDRIFVSRTGRWRRRRCRNTREVEQFFESHGFTVIYPEQLDLSTQAGIFASAPIIAGFGGSAIFNVMFSKNLKTLILLSHEAYTARNEHLYSSLLGCSVHYFWSPPDIPHPENGWSQKAFDCDWEFNFARNQESLGELLASL
jgi:hypothetical protein